MPEARKPAVQRRFCALLGSGGWRPNARERRSPASVERDLEHGLALIRHGEFFAAHEELELAWRASEPAEKDFFQGLVHVTVAWYQAGRGNRVGCERQLEKAVRRLARYAPAHRGVDVDAVLRQVRDAAAAVAEGSLALPPVRL